MSDADRIILEAELAAADAKVRFLREHLGEQRAPSPSAPTGGRRSLARKRSERVLKPSSEEMEGVTDLDRQRAQQLLAKGGKYR